MLPYFILILSISLISIFPFQKKIKLSFVCIILFIFSALRFDIGTDFNVYYKVTSGIIDIRENNYMLFEPFNVIIIKYGYYLNTPQFYFVVTSFVTITLIFKTIYNYSYSSTLSSICFIGFPMFYLETLNIVRQFAAMSIILYSLKYIYNKNILKFSICIICASLFHVTAIIGFVLYISNWKIISRKINFFLIIISFFTGKVILVILSYFSSFSKVAYYLKSQEQGYFFVFLAILLIGMLNLIFYSKLVNKDSRNRILINIFNFGLCVFIIFQQLPVFAGRFAFYFLLFLILLLPEYIRIFKQKSFLLITLYSVFVFLFFIRIWYSDLLFKTGKMSVNPYIPYKTVFTKNKLDFI